MMYKIHENTPLKATRITSIMHWDMTCDVGGWGGAGVKRHSTYFRSQKGSLPSVADIIL